jgi:hypothetical protein
VSTANQGRGADAAKAAATGTWEPVLSSCAGIAPASRSDTGKEWETRNIPQHESWTKEPPHGFTNT